MNIQFTSEYAVIIYKWSKVYVGKLKPKRKAKTYWLPLSVREYG